MPSPQNNKPTNKFTASLPYPVGLCSIIGKLISLPLVEQSRIVAEDERRLAVIDKLETLVTPRPRQSILQQAYETQSN